MSPDASELMAAHSASAEAVPSDRWSDSVSHVAAQHADVPVAAGALIAALLRLHPEYARGRTATQPPPAAARGLARAARAARDADRPGAGGRRHPARRPRSRCAAGRTLWLRLAAQRREGRERGARS